MKARTRSRSGARRGGYGEDLAYIHAAGFAGLARSAARELIRARPEAGDPRGLVVDLGCGDGILARELTRAGYPVLGVDLSPEMVALARARAPRARFRVGSALSVELPSCAAVASVGECLSYLFDGPMSEDRMARLFRRIHRALLPGGVFLFDVASPGRTRGASPGRIHLEGKDWAVLVALEEDAPHRVLTRRITSFRRIGQLYRRSVEVHRQRLFHRETIASLLRAAGFRTRAIAGYGGEPFSRGQIGFLARKPASA